MPENPGFKPIEINIYISVDTSVLGAVTYTIRKLILDQCFFMIISGVEIILLSCKARSAI